MSQKRKYIKNGNPDHFSYFNDDTIERMTANQKSLWTLAKDEIPTAGIPEEVQDFMTKKQEVKGRLEDVNDDLGDAQPPETKKEPEPEPEPEQGNETVDTEADFYREKLKELGIRVAHNAKTETLKKKYKDAIARV